MLSYKVSDHCLYFTTLKCLYMYICPDFVSRSSNLGLVNFRAPGMLIRIKTVVLKSSYMSRLMTKPTKWHVRPAKTQISLGIWSVLSDYSLCTQWVAKDPSFLYVDSEDSDQTEQMPR